MYYTNNPESPYHSFDEYKRDIWYYKLYRKLSSHYYSEGIFKGRGDDEYCSGFNDVNVLIPEHSPKVLKGRINDNGKKIFKFLDEFYKRTVDIGNPQQHLPFETVEILTHGFPDEKTIMPYITPEGVDEKLYDFFFFIDCDKQPYSVIHRYYKNRKDEDISNVYDIRDHMIDSSMNPYKNLKIGHNPYHYRNILFTKFADTQGYKIDFGKEVVELFLDALETLS